MNPDYIKALLKLTKVSSSEVVAATIAYLCHGINQLEAAETNGVKQESIARLAKRIRELDALVTDAARKKMRYPEEATAI
jgi:hypothetical protein